MAMIKACSGRVCKEYIWKCVNIIESIQWNEKGSQVGMSKNKIKGSKGPYIEKIIKWKQNPRDPG